MPAYFDPGVQVINAALFTVDANGNPTAVSTSSPVAVTSGAPTAANVLSGYQTFSATTAATTVISVPAGRTWQGTVTAAASVSVAAAASTGGQARAVISTAGVGVIPAAGSVLAVEAKAGANAATGTVGTQGSSHVSSPLVVIAPAGNAVTVQVVATIAGTSGVVDVSAIGALL